MRWALGFGKKAEATLVPANCPSVTSGTSVAGKAPESTRQGRPSAPAASTARPGLPCRRGLPEDAAVHAGAQPGLWRLWRSPPGSRQGTETSAPGLESMAWPPGPSLGQSISSCKSRLCRACSWPTTAWCTASSPSASRSRSSSRMAVRTLLLFLRLLTASL